MSLHFLSITSLITPSNTDRYHTEMSVPYANLRTAHLSAQVVIAVARGFFTTVAEAVSNEYMYDDLTDANTITWEDGKILINQPTYRPEDGDVEAALNDAARMVWSLIDSQHPLHSGITADDYPTHRFIIPVLIDVINNCYDSASEVLRALLTGICRPADTISLREYYDRVDRDEVGKTLRVSLAYLLSNGVCPRTVNEDTIVVRIENEAIGFLSTQVRKVIPDEEKARLTAELEAVIASFNK